MKSVLSLVAVVLCLAVTEASIAVITAGDCPAVAGQATLNATRYLGKWYEYKRFPAVFEAGLQCTSAQYGLLPNGISVTNGGAIRVNLFGHRYTIKNTSIQGNATIPDPSKPAELSVTFFGPATGTPNYFVQNTDYDNYSVIFSCYKLPEIDFNVQFAWILTRVRGQAPSNLSDLESALTNAGVNVSNFFIVDQEGCDSPAIL